MKKVGIVNLGCARNLVDSQAIAQQYCRRGYHLVDVEEADIAIVNTCGFIEEAKKESIDAILDLLERKKQGYLKEVVIAGCLAERYRRELREEFQEADQVLGVQKLQQDAGPQEISFTPSHYAYLKICESCYNQCAFCVIPRIKGKFVSRTKESIWREAEALDRRGVKEINIIGQDITAYGMDLYRQKALAELLKELTPRLRQVQWVRLLYAFPAHVTDDLIEVMASEPKICSYIDIPLQHINDGILRRMNRNITRKETEALVNKFRKAMPSAVLRTTFVVGLPGETDKDFEELVDFVRNARFEKVGVFVYSPEEGTPAYAMPGQVPSEIKQQRYETLMAVQREVSARVMADFLGRTVRVLVDEVANAGERIYSGRTEYDAPEVDGVVYVHAQQTLRPGEFVDVRVTDTCEYDLIGDEV